MVLMVSLQKQIYLILETKKMFYISRYPVPQFSLFFGFPKRKDSASALQQAKHGKNSTYMVFWQVPIVLEKQIFENI